MASERLKSFDENSVRRTNCALDTGRTKKRMKVTIVIARKRTPAHAIRLTRYASIALHYGAWPRAVAQLLGEVLRSEERRVGKECRSGWSPYREKKKTTKASMVRG